MQNIFQTVFYDDDGFFEFTDLIDQFDRHFTGFRIQIGQRFIKQQNIHIVYHDTGQRYPLFLAAGQLMRVIAEMRSDINQLCHLLYTHLHLILRHTVILQRKGNIFCDTETDELSVGILQYRSDLLGKLKK